MWCRRHTGRLRTTNSAVLQPYSWAIAVAWAETELVRLRTLLEADQEPTATSTIRGEIKALKRLLAQPEQVARAAQATAQFAGQ